MSLKFQDMAENRCRSGGRSSLFLPLHGLASYPEGAARKILCVLLFSAIDTKKSWCERDMSVYNEYKCSLQSKPFKRRGCLRCKLNNRSMKMHQGQLLHFHVSISIDLENSSTGALFIVFCFWNGVDNRCCVNETISVLLFWYQSNRVCWYCLPENNA